MLCENCKKNIANTYFKQTVNGKTSEIFLCSECAAKLGVTQNVTGDSDFGFGELINGLFSPYYHPTPLYGGSKKTEKAVCSVCSMTEEEFFAKGKAGCGNCYSAFKNRIAPLLNRIHGNKKHSGKRPFSTEKAAAEPSLGDLKKELTAAVKNEDFEKAVILRDKIKELEARQQNKERKERP